MSLLLIWIYFTPFFGGFIVNFEQINVFWSTLWTQGIIWLYIKLLEDVWMSSERRMYVPFTSRVQGESVFSWLTDLLKCSLDVLSFSVSMVTCVSLSISHRRIFPSIYLNLHHQPKRLKYRNSNYFIKSLKIKLNIINVFNRQYLCFPFFLLNSFYWCNAISFSEVQHRVS